MFKTRCCAALALTLCLIGTSNADFIDFEGMGFSQGNSNPVIGIASFTGDIAIQGGSRGAFSSAAGNDTGNTGSFNQSGNVFITNPGGDVTPPIIAGMRTSTITVDFSTAVKNLSFQVADIDFNEQLVAEIFDENDVSLGLLVINSPGGSPGPGDGVVSNLDFGLTTGIAKLTISNSIAAPFPGIFPGFGADNFEFEPVPEPTSLTLWAIMGLTGAAAGWRRFRRRQLARGSGK